MARSRGRVVVVGVCMQPDMIFPALAIIKEVELRFVVAYHRRDFELALEMLDRGRHRGSRHDHRHRRPRGVPERLRGAEDADTSSAR